MDSTSPQTVTVSMAGTRSVAGATIDPDHISRWMAERGVVVTHSEIVDATTLKVTHLGNLLELWPRYDHPGSRKAAAKSQVQAATTLAGFRVALITLLDGLD